jgi:hypothetical protein
LTEVEELIAIASKMINNKNNSITITIAIPIFNFLKLTLNTIAIF